MNNYLKELEDKIKSAYEEAVTIPEAEKLAAEFLYAQSQVSDALKTASLDARMRKSGVKAIRAAVYLEKRSSPDGKPTEAAIAAMVDSDAIVQSEQNALDEAEVLKEDLERRYDIFENAHIFFRGVAKGSFGS